MKKKTVCKILLPILILIAVIVAIEGTAQTPFSGIKRIIWYWKHKDVEKTWIHAWENVATTGDDVIAEYNGDIYREEYNEETDENHIYVYDKNEKRHEVEGLDKSINANMVFSWAVMEERFLMLLGESYSKSYFSEEDAIYSSGRMGFYNGAVVVAINMETREIVDERLITEGKVVYIDKEQYIVMDHDEIRFYELSTGKLIREELLEVFEVDREYLVESTYKEKIVIYMWDEENGKKMIGKYKL